MSTPVIEEQTVTVGDVDVHVATAGDPSTPALLFLHGLYDRWESWESAVRAFSSEYRVLAPDLRGHARSSHPKSNYAPHDYVTDLIGMLDQMGVQEVVPIGHSLGAIVAEFLAAYHPDRVRALVLVDPPFEQTEQTREWLNTLLEAKRGSVEETYEIVKEMNIMIDDEAEWRRETDWIRATADGPFEELIEAVDTGRTAQWYEVLQQITQPVLLLQADPNSGGVLSDAGAEMIQNHLQDCLHEKFQGCGHSIHLEQGDEFVRVVEDFLGRSL